MELFRTKFEPPPKAASTIARPRLLDLCSRITAHRLTLVRAPAGYGKTTLLAAWHAHLKGNRIATAWLTLDSRERTATRLIASLTASLAHAGHVECSPGTLRDDRQSLEDRIARLIERLCAIGDCVVLMLDHVTSIDDNASAAMTDLLRHLPGNAHVVIASRERPDMPTAALRAYGEALDIGAAELAFTANEAAELLATSPLSHPLNVATLLTQTEGWATGLRLAVASENRKRGEKNAGCGIARSRETIADYFAENVVATLDENERRFVLETSILDQLTPDLCNAVAGRNDSHRMLLRLEQAGAFIFAVEGGSGRRRYHPLFSEYSRRELADANRARFVAVHRQAARTLADRSEFTTALHHAAQAEDHELLASILERSAEHLTYNGKLSTFARYATLLPHHVLARCPWTLLSVAWLKIRGLHVDEGRRLLKLASDWIDEARRRGRTDADDLEALALVARHREMVLAAAQDDARRVELMCGELIRRFVGTRPFVASTLYGQLIAARREQFRFDDLEKLHARGCVTAERSGYRFALVALHSAAGLSFWAAGRSDAAVSVLNKGLAEAFHWAGRNSGLAALVALPLAEIAYERNDLAEASAYLDGYMPVARELCFVDQLIAGHIVASRLRAAKGDLVGAERALDDASRVALECDLERLSLAVLSERVRLLIRGGRSEAAARLAAQVDIGKTGCQAPQSSSTTSDELRAVIATRIAISQNRAAPTLPAIRHWRAFCQHRGAVRSLVRWDLLMAQALMTTGERLAAQRATREAIVAAAPMHAVRSFTDEGPAVLAVLAEAYLDAPPTEHPSDIFARSVLDAFAWKDRHTHAPVADGEGLNGKLSAKEIEILTLVDYGMRNREIGNRLGLTEGSVKWYMQQVYDKVGIRRRSQAVERARRLGLMP